MAEGKCTIAEYILRRVKQLGADHAFCVPGDFVLSFCKSICDHPELVKYVGTCNELNAAYAADAYGRMKGLGVVVTTYAVGELSAINGVAGSYAERVPVVVITGSPTTGDQKLQPLLHHTLGDYKIPKKMYDMISGASTLLDNPKTAGEEIDRVLQVCITEQCPVYVSLPSNMVNVEVQAPSANWQPQLSFQSDEAALLEAVAEAAQMLNQAKSPVIMADVELHRYRLQQEFSALLDKSGYPYVTLIMGKCILDEDHPQFIGLYGGKSSRQYVRERVENADCVLSLGTLLSDLNSGGFTVHPDKNLLIDVHHNRTKIKNHTYENVAMKDFITELGKRLQHRSAESLHIKPASQGCTHRRTEKFQPDPAQPITIKRFFDRMAHFIPERAIVIAETGNSEFAAAETMMPKGVTVISQVFFGSIGYTIGATLGAALACPDRKVILFIGDGSFQVTCQDVSTMIRYNTNPVIFLVNNDGYLIERVIIDGPFNDIQMWKYHMLSEVFGGKKGFDVKIEGELEVALREIQQDNKSLALVEIHTDKWDGTEGVKNAGEAMRVGNQK